MATMTILIGNTDNKLSQQEWSKFYQNVERLVDRDALTVEFSGASRGDAPWQNACWVITVVNPAVWKDILGEVAAAHRQDSIALLVGDTEFVEAK